MVACRAVGAVAARNGRDTVEKVARRKAKAGKGFVQKDIAAVVDADGGTVKSSTAGGDDRKEGEEDCPGCVQGGQARNRGRGACCGRGSSHGHCRCVCGGWGCKRRKDKGKKRNKKRNKSEHRTGQGRCAKCRETGFPYCIVWQAAARGHSHRPRVLVYLDLLLLLSRLRFLCRDGVKMRPLLLASGKV